MKRFIPIFILLTLSSSVGNAEELSVKSGSLARMKSEELAAFVTLTLTGEIDATDLAAIRDNCDALRTLDLSGIKIVKSTTAHQANGSVASSAADILPEGALFGSKITELLLPAGIKSIEDFSLACTGITSLDIPSSVTRIGNCAFSGSSLKNINLPATVAELGDYVFLQCEDLQIATLSCNYITHLPLGTFMGCKSLETLNASKIRTLGEKSLSGTPSLTKFAHATLERIEDRALEGSGLKELDAKWVKAAGDYAFAFMPSLEKLDISGYHTEYGKGALAGCPVLANHTPDGENVIPDLLYADSPNIDFSNTPINTASVGEYALLNNQTQKLVLKQKVASLADGSLEGMTALKDIDVTYLYDTPPAATDKTFTGIDRKNVTLTVAEKTGQIWSSAEGWKEFKINELTGIDDTPADIAEEKGISFRIDKGILYITAATSIQTIDLFDTAGLHIVSATPGTNEYSIELSSVDSPVIILNVKTSDASRTVKFYK